MDKINVLIIGNGGREHAIAKKLSVSNCHLYYYGPNENPGMNKYCKVIGLGHFNDIDHIREVAISNKINLVVIGPELPLSLGYADKFQKVGISVVGPTKDMAKIETSKIYCRNLMFDHGLSQYCPQLLHIIKKGDNLNTMADILESLMFKNDIVIKEDGLCGGKGVKVQGTHFQNVLEAINICDNSLKNGNDILIEEKLIGEEFSIMSFSDGYYFKHMIPVKDFKRLLDGDSGPNTGSMGSVTGYEGKLWFLNDNDIQECHQINEKVLEILRQMNGKPYKGILYGSFMKTINKKIKVIEFNARFGDPECINVLELLETDLLEIFKAIGNQSLSKIELKFNPNASVFKYKVPQGYPDSPIKGELIQLNEEDHLDNIIYSSIENINGCNYKTLGSRTFGVVQIGKNLDEISVKVNQILDNNGKELFYRKDIGLNLSLSYKKAGVNSDEKEAAIKEIQENIKSTYNSDVVSDFGDFAGLIKFNDNTLITSTDGVGTKSILILDHYGYEKGFEKLGRDLVYLNVNDILVKGGQPLFFVDYFGCQKLDANHLKYFIKGVVEGCKQVNCVLLKGETAQMPDIYQEDTFDLVGTVVGYVEKDKMIDGKKTIQDGDFVIGLPSNGPHTNGFTLIRKILDRYKVYDHIDDEMMDLMCSEHKCYLDDIQKLKDDGVDIHGLCHITGGGLIENPSRVMADDLEIQYYEKDLPKVFKYLQEKGHLSDYEMMKTFNCGIGMMVFMSKDDYYNKNVNYEIIGKVVKIKKSTSLKV